MNFESFNIIIYCKVKYLCNKNHSLKHKLLEEIIEVLCIININVSNMTIMIRLLRFALCFNTKSMKYHAIPQCLN